MNNNVLENIKHLCKKNNISIYQLSKETGIPASTLYGLFESDSYPTIPQINLICNFFCITISDFFNDTNKPLTNSEFDYILLEKFNHLSPINKKLVTTYIDGLNE